MFSESITHSESRNMYMYVFRYDLVLTPVIGNNGFLYGLGDFFLDSLQTV